MAAPKSCVQCGKCLDVCPLFKATGREELTPRAKFFLETLDSSEGLREKDFKSLAELCLSCGRCAENCPQNMSGPELVSELRSQSKGIAQICWDFWLAQPGLIWPLACVLSKLSPEGLPEPFGSAKKRMKSLFANKHEPWAELAVQVKFEKRKVALFKGCVGRYARPDWVKKAESLMNGMGLVRAAEPKFSCCGSSYKSAGLLERLSDSRQKNIRAWQDAGCPLLITFCATCLKGLKEYSLDDFSGDAQLREKWLAALIPLSSLLLDAEVRLSDNAPEQVVYHKPCHAPVDDPDRTLIGLIAAGRLLPVQEDLCCGFGGVMQLSAPELSKQVGMHCMDHLSKELKTGGNILTGCSACVIQLATIAKDEYFAAHWLDILK
ncbi:(Fe-S)-binding protein [Maridesulfovibrio hydrothermalis]|uniref:Putative Glycolate oxidase, iron-sulfur subunit n=1 Tax=Maridesulfovibrio hydrothermalis AM13 = DSM 14728 TaxID=1121451 RepID=L0R7R8_9BACT|nr:(Fe-S)-binding protein [Maridesulfovibrio hydrothermalis]CCO22778.1 putative Glycolate oxidase, iron-sulfur subunit [Maridesulfovibrio hydrothermalis AM13 = DSM 14728]